MNLNEIIQELQSLRNDVEAAESALFLRAEEIEKGGVWKQAGVASFDKFLTEYNICAPQRYREYIAARKMPDVNSAAEEIGVHATAEAGKIADKGRRAKFIEAAKKRKEVKGVAWSQQQASNERRNIAGTPPRDSSWNERIVTEEKMRLELVETKRALHAAEKRIRELEKEVARLRDKKQVATVS